MDKEVCIYSHCGNSKQMRLNILESVALEQSGYVKHHYGIKHNHSSHKLIRNDLRFKGD